MLHILHDMTQLFGYLVIALCAVAISWFVSRYGKSLTEVLVTVINNYAFI